MNTKVSIVVPNFNGKQYVMECMDALMDQDVRSFEVILVDDASTDGSLQMVMDKYPDNGAYPKTRYISRKKNGGFCKAVNDGIRAADSEYILLLNNDTKVERDFVKQMYASIRRSDKIFSVSAKMLMMQDETLMDDSGDLYNALGWAYTKSKGKPEEKFNKRRKIFAACGGAAIYRKDILDKIGYFDDNHFAYLEDIDIGYRAKLNGYVNIYEPRARVLHLGSATSGSRYNEFKAKYSARNNIYLIYKNMPLWQKIVNFPWLLIGFMVKTFFYTIKGMGLSYVKGIFEGLKLIKTPEAKLHRVDFGKISLGRQLLIELELIINIFRRFI